MSNDDLDDFVTINITCDQASALARLLTSAHETGLFHEALDPHQQAKLAQFSETMTMEIQIQKTGMKQ